MEQALGVSNVLLWISVVIMGGVILALVRQVGVLHERIAPVGALVTGSGPRVGETAPPFELADLRGEPASVGGEQVDGLHTLLFFLSPTCPVCKTLLPVLDSIVRRERRWLRVLLASDGPRAEHEAFVADRGLESFPYLLSAELGVTYRVSRLPFAVLIDSVGVIRAQGLVNSREHVESLFEANELGVGSLQDFFADERKQKGAA